MRARGLRKVLGGVGLLGVEPGPTAATGGRRAVERPLGLPTSVCARGRAWERRSELPKEKKEKKKEKSYRTLSLRSDPR